ncbi:uncharacterized protein RHIMIDRAFT_256000 [Rhizopus microsporus ATCC 52813]|uniref:PHD-type domain-containing protein n=1 Tax=Rhizopus microsporus ATCC 52813 TaxID=1340429 RepID=A0A2G4SSI4_RHIZD|nr:uncharacterized protein RHIMIDRAFT_256000 [Rhizopus microsporus ATCC 52813]PHZ11711.1 hypothetical protein RHIMIDRAFT_256000 [Rhizopus microsporus ATCC 52813]
MSQRHTSNHKSNNNNNARSRTRKTRTRTSLYSDEDSSVSDGNSTTRCICKQSHSAGLMVQCDKCEVWQHCSCMGLQAEKLPEQYYCELCRPDFHQLIKNPNGRPKRLYDATGTDSAPSDNKISETKGPIKRRRKTNTRSTTSATATATLNVTPYWNHTDGKPNEEPPISAKVKYPNSKMTITDMNKRTQQIMEYLMKLKNEQPLIQTPGRSRSYSTCSSLSSVSTPTDGAPLTPTLSGKDDEEESIELIEKISKDIIEFQQRFGIVNQL